MSDAVDTRNRILDVAQDLIQRRGLNAMSFQDLSDSVGIKKRVFITIFRVRIRW